MLPKMPLQLQRAPNRLGALLASGGYKYRRRFEPAHCAPAEASEMKHLLTALVALLSILPRGELLGSGPPCPRRYLRRINGKCYYFSVKKMNWFGALNNCLRKGLTLADLSNQRDFDGAIGFLSGLGNTEDFWFGGNDLYHEGRFQYISNGRLVRYYSNYSNVLPLEHSECDDCLEVRIRSEINMVSADNCHERQYFICSERYCQDTDSGKKPKHHSHEHLHHFHHDIGESAEGEGEGEGDGDHDRQDPIASGSVEHPEPDSEDAAAALDVPDDDQPDQNGVSVTPGAEVTNTVDGTGEPGATAAPAAGAEAVSPAADGAAPAGAAPAAEGAATPAADGATPEPTHAPGAEAPAAAAAETPAPPAA